MQGCERCKRCEGARGVRGARGVKGGRGERGGRAARVEDDIVFTKILATSQHVQFLRSSIFWVSGRWSWDRLVDISRKG